MGVPTKGCSNTAASSSSPAMLYKPQPLAGQVVYSAPGRWAPNRQAVSKMRQAPTAHEF
jgi:hypothetical protein